MPSGNRRGVSLVWTVPAPLPDAFRKHVAFLGGEMLAIHGNGRLTYTSLIKNLPNLDTKIAGSRRAAVPNLGAGLRMLCPALQPQNARELVK